MTEIETLVARIQTLSEGYQPSEEVASELQKKSALGVIGPFGIGKSTLMRRMEELDSELSYVLGIVTRPKRPHEADGIYRHLPHTEEQLQSIIQQLERGELVQVAVHPSTGYIYGSDLESYKKPFNVLDILTTVLDEFEQLPFKSFRKAYVVVPVDQWEKRIKQRKGEQTPDDIRKRWQEAKLSLEWGIEHADEVSWIINASGELEDTAQKLIDVAKSGDISDSGAIQIAHEMLQRVNDELARAE